MTSSGIWLLIVIFSIVTVGAGFRMRRYLRIMKINDDYPGQPPPHAPPPGSEDAEWERQQRLAWEREHPDWADWARSYDKEAPQDAQSGSDDSEGKP